MHPGSLPGLMKKYITCTLLSITISYIIYAQDSVHPDFDKISTPYIYFEGSFNGKNLLFDNNWVKARLLTANNSIISNDSFLFNFDKIDQRLLVTADFKKVSEIDWREFKAILFYLRDTAYIFKHIYFISNKDLFQVIINDKSKYSLYKTIHTKLIKGYYGATTYSTPNSKSGDQYMDVPEYCILFPNKEYRIIHLLKRASIERVFKLNPDGDIVANFLNMAGNKESYEEDDLIQLILYLNKETL
jgi:hypothetical protein